MRLAIFGATGQTGRHVLRLALEAGHAVTALARDPDKIGMPHPQLRVVRGSVADANAVAAALDASDRVISALGAGEGTLTTFADAVVGGMTERGLDRIVSLVGASLDEPGDVFTWRRRALKGITTLFAGDRLVDGHAHARRLEASLLRYTLVRPPRLTQGPATGRIEHGATLDLGPFSSIARADLAAFLLEVTVRDWYLRAAPMVASVDGRGTI